MILALCVTGFALTVNAQQEEKKKTTIELPQWVKNIKFSGYGILQYQAMDPYKKGKDDDGNPILEKNSSNAFRLATSTGVPRFRERTPQDLASQQYNW